MSGATSWLKAQRKSSLVEIAEASGLKNYESLKKPELEAALDDHLQATYSTNSTSKDANVINYYQRADLPARKKSSTSSTAAVIEATTPAVKKRVSKVKDDITSAANEVSNAIARTPAPSSKQLIPANVPLPPSPAVVAQHIDRQLTRGRSKLTSVLKSSGVEEYSDLTRNFLSSAAVVQSLAILFEAYYVLTSTLGWKSLFTLPGFGTLIVERPAHIPDLFKLLTTDFWYPATAWFTISLGLPLLVSFFFNIALKTKSNKHTTRSTHPAGQFDPLTFNIAKVVLQWLVFTKAATVYGYPSLQSKALIEAAVPFGHQGTMVASVVGAVLSLYEAILRK